MSVRRFGLMSTGKPVATEFVKSFDTWRCSLIPSAADGGTPKVCHDDGLHVQERHRDSQSCTSARAWSATCRLRWNGYSPTAATVTKTVAGPTPAAVTVTEPASPVETVIVEETWTVSPKTVTETTTATVTETAEPVAANPENSVGSGI